jgi:RND family efflux transporter MFP subunit
LRADRTGVVTAVNAEPGQVVSAGQTVVRLAQPDQPEVAINIPEGRFKEFRAAKKISIVLWSVPGKLYHGSIRELSPVADAATRTFSARISVLNPDADVQLGMTANVVLDAGAQQVFLLPLPALTRVDGKPTVWVVDPATKTVAPRAVALAEYRSEDRVAVAGGIKAGDMVVMAGVHKLIAGQKVQPVQAEKASP